MVQAGIPLSLIKDLAIALKALEPNACNTLGQLKGRVSCKGISQ
jgi:hypothetical protein